MITRTRVTTDVTVKCADLNTDEIKNVEVLYNSKLDKFPTIRQLMNKLDTTEVMPLQVVGMTYNEELYGMEEDNFYNNAVRLDPKTRKPIQISDADLQAFNVG